MYSLRLPLRLFFLLLFHGFLHGFTLSVAAQDAGAEPQGTGYLTPDGRRAEKTFRICAGCHTLRPGAEHRAGPNLFGLMTRDIASAPGYVYSEELRAKSGRWTTNSLSMFLEKPKDFVPGNAMAYHGIKNRDVRDELVAWLSVATSKGFDPYGLDDIEALLSKGNPDRGRPLFRPCMTCHTYKQGQAAKIGPNLFGLVGRRSATFEGFNYSNPLRRRDVIWTPLELNRFFIEKKRFDQGTHRAFRKLSKFEDRADLIAWLKTLSDKGEKPPVTPARAP